MVYTAGIFLFNKFNELLITHPTHAPMDRWSIPKGLIDEGENVIEAALRELHEETNISLNDFNYVYQYVGKNVLYSNKKKTLCPVFCKVMSDFNNVELKCNSLVGGADFYENDIIKWVTTNDAMKLIHETQRIALNENKLL